MIFLYFQKLNFKILDGKKSVRCGIEIVISFKVIILIKSSLEQHVKQNIECVY